MNFLAFLFGLVFGYRVADPYVDRRRIAEMDRLSGQMGEHCELCNGTAVYVCTVCRKLLSGHTHENDYFCDEHGCVNPIRLHDGAVINGDGRCSSEPRVIAYAQDIA